MIALPPLFNCKPSHIAGRAGLFMLVAAVVPFWHSAAAGIDTTVRIATINSICNLLQAHFLDPSMRGLDWNAECISAKAAVQTIGDNEQRFQEIATSLPAKLKTSHTAYYPPDDAMLAILYSVYGELDYLKATTDVRGGAPELRGSGIFAVRIGDRDFIDQILDDSPAQKAGLREGDEIVAAGSAVFSAYWPGLKSAPIRQETTVQFRRRPDGPVEGKTLPLISGDALSVLAEATTASARLIERHGAKIGYLRGWTMLTREAAGGPAQAMQAAIYGKFADADAVILDARGKIGGGGMDILDVYFGPRTSLSWKGRGDDRWIDQKSMRPNVPLVIIVDGHTRSAAEVMAHVAKHQRRALLVGSRTAGAASGGSLFPLPDGGGLYIAVAALRSYGEVLEGKGVEPDILVERSLPYADGADPQLERAIEEATRLARRN
ncbi:S41 family peptidase [Phyllobacterium salinisoli]|nr:S41 family peptidase [Phyllobacterium salinisoli]